MNRAIALLFAIALLAGTGSHRAAAEADPHGDHDHGAEAAQTGSAGHNDEDANIVRLTPAQITLARIVSAPVTTTVVGETLTLPAELGLNPDRVVQIMAPVAGRIRTVAVTLGADVKAGATLAVIESRELAAAKAAYLAARSKARLADTTLAREEALWRDKISAEQDYLAAKQGAAAARIETEAAAHALRALGLDPGAVAAGTGKAANLAQLTITAPFAGTVIARDAVQGALVGPDTALLRLADLSTIWVTARVAEANLAAIRLGQPAQVSVRAYPGRPFAGRIGWVGAELDETTRTLPVRIEVTNPDRTLKAGMFGTASIVVGDSRTAVTVPATAIQDQGAAKTVFVALGDGRFERRTVQLGAPSGNLVEIRDGLAAGAAVVTEGGFTLASELGKGSMAVHSHD